MITMIKSNEDNIVALVPAAGIGARMNSPIAKQYIKIGALTILEYTLNNLLAFPLIEKIVVVLHPNDNQFHLLPISQHAKIQITYGGENRADSVLAGLMLLENDDWVLVHDAARPCVNHADISNLIKQTLRERKGGILATRVTDTIKKTSCYDMNYIEQTCDRRLLWAAATPQMFNVKQLRENLAFALKQGLTITDEASAMELAGIQPRLVECRRDNIKITRMEDLALAKFFLQEQGFYQES